MERAGPPTRPIRWRPDEGDTFATHIGEVDPAGGMFRYRGVPLGDLVGAVSFESVWSLLVDDDFTPRLPQTEPFPLAVHTGDTRVDVQSALAQLAPVWGFRPLHDITRDQAREQLARATVMALSFIAQSARGPDLPAVPQREVDRGRTVVERFLIRWRDEADPKHAEALDAYLVVAAEHGFTPSTLTARVIASTGADVAACLSGAVGAISGPLHGGAPSRVLHMLEAAERAGDVNRYVEDLLAGGHRVMGFGHRVYRAEDPRATVLRAVCGRLSAPRYDVAVQVERAVQAQLSAIHPERPLATNMEFWAAVLLDAAQVPATMLTPMFICARTAGWSAHILEQQESGRFVRPVARYLGHGPRAADQVTGWAHARHAS